MIRLAMVLLLGSTAAALAEPPVMPACAPAEPAVVCMLKVQRNSVMDELAMEAAAHRIDRDSADERAKALAEYWARYTAGLHHEGAKAK